MRLAGALFAVLLAAPARATTSLGGDWTTGLGTRGWDAKTTLDIDDKKAWEAGATYAYLHTVTGTESRSQQLTLSLSHDVDEAWSARGSLTGWRDTINTVDYFGPSVGVSYTARAGAPRSDGPADEAWRLSFDSDLYEYRADQESARTIVIRRRLVTVTNQGAVTLAQWHPYISFEHPLFSGAVVPSLTAGHLFYSKGPSLIEQRAGQPRFSSSAGSISGLVGGLQQNSGQAALTFYLPWDLRLGVSAGLQQSATDLTWSTTQGAQAGAVLFDHAELSLSFNRTIQGGQHSDTSTGGLSWLF